MNNLLKRLLKMALVLLVAGHGWAQPTALDWEAASGIPGSEHGQWSVVAGADRYLAVERDGRVFGSVDGGLWYLVAGDLAASGPVEAQGVEWGDTVYGRGRFVAFGGGWVAVSADGVGWAVGSMGSSAGAELVCAAGGADGFVAVVKGAEGRDVMYSADGLGWARVGDGAHVRAMAAGWGGWVLGGDREVVMVQGVDWSGARRGALGWGEGVRLTGLACRGDLLVAAGSMAGADPGGALSERGLVAVSSDRGETWALADGDFHGVTGAGDVGGWLALFGGGVVWASGDGVAWMEGAAPMGRVDDMASCWGGFVAAGPEGLAVARPVETFAAGTVHGVVGEPLAAGLSGVTGAVEWAVCVPVPGPMPAGVVFDAGQIGFTGVPQRAGAFGVAVVLRDGGGVRVGRVEVLVSAARPVRVWWRDGVRAVMGEAVEGGLREVGSVRLGHRVRAAAGDGGGGTDAVAASRSGGYWVVRPGGGWRRYGDAEVTAMPLGLADVDGDGTAEPLVRRGKESWAVVMGEGWGRWEPGCGGKGRVVAVGDAGGGVPEAVRVRGRVAAWAGVELALPAGARVVGLARGELAWVRAGVVEMDGEALGTVPGRGRVLGVR